MIGLKMLRSKLMNDEWIRTSGQRKGKLPGSGKKLAQVRTAPNVAMIISVFCSTIQPLYAVEQIVCVDVSSEPTASAEFDTFCGQCHDATKLANSHFEGVEGEVADRRESELAAFLDRHSACPHRLHEGIAAWLRNLSNQP